MLVHEMIAILAEIDPLSTEVAPHPVAHDFKDS